MDDNDFRALSERMDVFCPFDATGISHQEIRHSNFLSYIIDPSRPHGLGTAGLVAFTDALLANSASSQTRLLLRYATDMNVEVRREWRNIDLLLIFEGSEGSAHVFAIEIKIGAAETKDQLPKYAGIVEAEWPNAIKRYFFLTVKADEPSDDRWEPVSFLSVVENFERMMKTRGTAEAGADMLRAYVAMMRRRHLDNPDLEELATRIWARHGMALNYLMEQRPNPMRDLSGLMQSPEVFGRVASAVKEQTGHRIKLESSSNTYTRISVPAWDPHGNIDPDDAEAGKRLLLCELECYGKRVHVRFQINPGDAAARESIYTRISQHPTAQTGSSKSLTGKWTRLAAETIHLSRAQDDHQMNLELEKVAPKVQSRLVDFLVEHIPPYTDALSRQEVTKGD
ncbi:PD-(D/E)XK nuclease family protein [Rhodobacteraceae bacterium M385]|nr:PD-(D/E)XK nuclease family protein [Rhodobacteraceae bacterium M385]